MGRNYRQDVDRVSIEQLAATLESRIGGDGQEKAEGEAVALGDRDSREASAPALPPILVAHPNPSVRAAVRAALERNFQVLEAEDGEDAWETLAAHRDVRLLVTGTGLPRLEGIELIRRLRRPNGPSHLVGLPVMVYADREDPATKQTALLAGANDYLTQDTEPGTLLARVQARNRLFEQSRRAMNLTGTMPTARAGRTEVPSGAAAPPGAGRDDTRTRSPVERPIWVEARGGNRSAPAGARGWAERLYRISSTTTITLTATVLVILAITLILLLNHTPQRSQSLAVGRVDGAAPAERSTDAKEAPAGETEPVDSRVAPSPGTRGTDPVPTLRDDQPARVTPTQPSPSTTAAAVEHSRTATANTSRTDRNGSDEVRRPASAELRTRPPAKSTAGSRSATETQVPAGAAAPNSVQAPAPPTREVAPTPRAEEPKPAAREPPPAPTVTETAKAPREAPPGAKAGGSSAEEPPAMPSEPEPADMSVAAAAAPAASAPPRPTPARLSRDELSSLLQRFVSVYEAGDIEQFMALLGDNVQTNDRVTRQAVREDYDRLFRTTDLRQMRIDTMSWDVENDRAHGWGEFEVRVRRQGDATVHHYQGSITVQVRKAGGRPRIERLYHSERRASR